METATLVSGSGTGAAGASGEKALGCGGGISLGDASTILLRSRWLRLVIRADCSEGYDEDILPR